MSMQKVVCMSRISVEDFERYHAARIVRKLPPASVQEVLCTIIAALFMAPFTVVTFLVIPVMGQVTVLLSVSLTLLYLYYRRSIVVSLAAIGSTIFFWSLLFITIQAIKNNLEVPLFFFTALGIPVSAMYSMFIASRIWIVRGGAE